MVVSGGQRAHWPGSGGGYSRCGRCKRSESDVMYVGGRSGRIDI